MKIILVILISISLPFSALASRIEPEDIEPVVHKGVRYSAPHWGKAQNRDQNAGYIEAWDIKRNEFLWILKVYTIHYVRGLEGDVQDIFITSMKLHEEKLIVINERGDKFIIDINTKEIIPKNKVYKSDKQRWWEFWK